MHKSNKIVSKLVAKLSKNSILFQDIPTYILRIFYIGLDHRCALLITTVLPGKTTYFNQYERLYLGHMWDNLSTLHRGGGGIF